MPVRDRLLAALVAVLWGLNFPAIAVSLEQFPPYFLVALRFALIAVPTVLLVSRPAVPWGWVLGYGLGFGVLQFVFLYSALDRGMPPGLASLVLQSSAPFTVVLAGALLRERLTGRQCAGVALAVAGLAGIAAHRAEVGGGAMLLPVLLTLGGGLGWALGNLCSRQARGASPFRLTLWMTVVPPLPMLAASLLLEGRGRIGTSLSTLDTQRGAIAVGGLAFTVLVATLVGSGIWTTLMSRHPTSTVAPFSLLVPVVGTAASALLFDERLHLVEMLCGVVVVTGVLLGAGAGRTRRAALVRPEVTGPHDVRAGGPREQRV
ncbi:MAG: eamA [Modestobacter sp.]|jgi:O-acetylserine/cysteine efflux transporter|nr:eamA [Modestobacter sp.]